MKSLRRLLLTLVILTVIVTVIVIFKLGAVVKTAVETMGPSLTGGTVTLQQVSIRPLRGKVRMEGLLVGNPEGFNTPSAIALHKVTLDMDIRSVFSDTVIIHDILIDGPEITLEQPLTGKSNIKAILDNLQAATGTRPTEAPAKPKPTTPAKTVIIERLVIQNGRLNLSTPLLQGAAAPIALPTLTLTDIGKSGNGATIATTIAEVIGAILNASVSTATASIGALGDAAKLLGSETLQGVQNAAGLASDTGAKALDVGSAAATAGAKAVGDLVGGGTDAATEGARKLGAGAAKLAGGLGGLLGQDKPPATNPVAAPAAP